MQFCAQLYSAITQSSLYYKYRNPQCQVTTHLCNPSHSLTLYSTKLTYFIQQRNNLQFCNDLRFCNQFLSACVALSQVSNTFFFDNNSINERVFRSTSLAFRGQTLNAIISLRQNKYSV